MTNSTTSTIIIVVLIGALVCIVPLMKLTSRLDNVTQEKVESIIEDSLIEVTNTGKLTRSWYQNLENRLAATGNTYNIEIEIHHIDENVGMKTAQANYTKIGENVYYVEYTTQVLNQIGIKADDSNDLSSNDTIMLKEGDIIYLSAKNASPTSAQTQQSSFLNTTNVDEHVISTSSSKMVTVNGTSK